MIRSQCKIDLLNQSLSRNGNGFTTFCLTEKAKINFKEDWFIPPTEPIIIEKIIIILNRSIKRGNLNKINKIDILGKIDKKLIPIIDNPK